MSAPVRTEMRTMDTLDFPAAAASNVSGEESSGSSGTVQHGACVGCSTNALDRLGSSTQVSEDGR
jgi:hypothetical protein